MRYDARRALELLRLGSGSRSAIFRDGQQEAIQHIVEGRGRLLVVQKTGWGKSFVYFIATKLLREGTRGPALLVSPLLSLMRNQLAAARRMGVRAETINSDNVEDWSRVEAAIQRNQVDILLISPERLANDGFVSRVLVEISGKISLLVIDEAHCVSDWGHDFRPQYRLLERIVRTLPQNLRVLATTATANNRVMNDLRNVLGPDLHVSRGDLNRPSLKLQTIHLANQAERLAWLAERVPTLQGSGIIYTLTIAATKQVTAWLRYKGIDVRAYSGQTGEERPELEQALLENRVKALVATTALGMGYDKPDLSFVIHYQTPGSPVAYYQQVGRAGRALSAAYGVLLSGDEEESINDFFIESAFPTRDEVKAVLEVLEANRAGLSDREMLSKLNIADGRIRKTILALSLESPAPIAKQGTRWHLTAAPLNDSFWERAERMTSLRRQEQSDMQAYVRLTSGHMEFLIKALDGDPASVSTPPLPPLPITPAPALVEEAIAFLQRTSIPIEPRKTWPTGGMPEYGHASQARIVGQAEEGRALSVWGDAGWGELVRKGMYVEGRIQDVLVTACAKMIREWAPEPAPTWVTSMPSTRNGTVVQDFTQRLSAALRLPFHSVLIKTDARPEQKTMANSTQQALNLDGALAVAPDATIPPGPVLLVDDLVRSRWTMTVAAWLLQKHGSGKVWPVALAFAGGAP